MSNASDASMPSPYAAAPAAQATSATRARSRIGSIDVMRGLVMLFMLVDHVRENIYYHQQVGDPMNLQTTSPELFFTRLSAHLCAPTFVFLTGLGAWLYANPAGQPPRSPMGFLLKRGLLLVFLEITVVNFAWAGDMPPHTLWLQVIWVIGLSMIVLALMSGLPRVVLAVVGFAIVFGHNLLTPISFPPGHPMYGLWTLLHERNFLVPDGPLKIKVTYPLLAWIGVILLGYVAGPLYSRAVDSARRIKTLDLLGIGCLALLLVLRGFNIYGETLPWQPGPDFIHSVMAFVDFTKYPPSLDFLLLTLGIAFLLLARFEGRDNALTRVIATFGSAPMFFYIMHLYVLLILQKLAVATIGPNHDGRFGVDAVHWVWFDAAVLAFVLYWPTRAFARFKHSSSQAWVRYF